MGEESDKDSPQVVNNHLPLVQYPGTNTDMEVGSEDIKGMKRVMEEEDADDGFNEGECVSVTFV